MERIWKGLAFVALALVLAGGAVYAQNPCFQPDNGTGTVTLPPAGCEYLSPDQVHMIIDGLPPGTTIILKPIHQDFICRKLGACGTPGGPLGGEVEDFTSKAVFQLSGTGALAGWSRTVTVSNVAVKVASGPRTLGASVQTIKTDMQAIQGSLSGDPDFAFFEIVGGTANGYSSPGQTVLTKTSAGTFRVDSKFKVGYRIRFEGAAGGRLAGYGGTTEGTVNMSAVDIQR